jgi:hypothetical protein
LAFVYSIQLKYGLSALEPDMVSLRPCTDIDTCIVCYSTEMTYLLVPKQAVSLIVCPCLISFLKNQSLPL